MRNRLDPEREHILIKQSRSHSESFRELYQSYFPRIYAYVAYRVGRVQDTEDLVSEAFLKAIEELTKFEDRGKGSFSAWLFCIVHNLVSDFYRRNQRLGEPLPLEILSALHDNTPSPDDDVVQKQEVDYLRQLINTLSPRRREVISLKFFGGLRNREIAEVLGVDERAVSSHLCRGLEELHRKYADDTMEMQARRHT